jgi:hypothetical protein
MTGFGLYGDFDFATVCVPGVIIVLFVLYVYFRDRSKRL